MAGEEGIEPSSQVLDPAFLEELDGDPYSYFLAGHCG